MKWKTIVAFYEIMKYPIPPSAPLKTISLPQALPERTGKLHASPASFMENIPDPTGQIAPRSLKVLLVDDERPVREMIRRMLEHQGHTVLCAATEQEAMEIYLKNGADLALVDLIFPGGEDTGFRLARRLRGFNDRLVLMVMTGNENVDYARQALEAQVFDFMAKPLSAQTLMFKMGRVAEHLRLSQDREALQQEVTHLRGTSVSDVNLDTVFGKSAPMQRLRKQVERLSLGNDVTVLITGESGTGKEVLARTLHLLSRRGSHPFVAVNCAGIPETLFETEFFGHIEGAFTDAKKNRRGYFEMAHGGTLFLDEVGELPLNLQAKILRALEDRRIRRVGAESDQPVDVRILCATNRSLRDMVAEKTFREDLFFRLSVMEIHLPPLREREEDTLGLARQFLDRFRTEMGYSQAILDASAQAALLGYHFPGNIRELKNLMERVALLTDGELVSDEDLMLPGTVVKNKTPAPLGDNLNLEAMERRLVQEALRRTGGNQTHAAKLLGVGHDALRYKVKKFELDPKEPVT